MKRLIANNQADIEIIMNLYIEEVQNANELVAHLNYITKLDDINLKYQVSNEFIDAFNELIDGVLKEIHNAKCEVSENYKSEKGYSYYIRFVLPNGDCRDIGFRISTHKMSHFQQQNNRWAKENVVAYDFRIGFKTVKSVHQAQEIIKNKLEEFKSQSV